MTTVAGAKEIAVEFFSLSKSYNMPGWRVGFMVGNRDLVTALARLKSYFSSVVRRRADESELWRAYFEGRKRLR